MCVVEARLRSASSTEKLCDEILRGRTEEDVKRNKKSFFAAALWLLASKTVEVLGERR